MTFLEELSIYFLNLLMYIISVMIFTFLISEFGPPKFLKSQFGHPVMKILAKSLPMSCGKLWSGFGRYLNDHYKINR